VSLHHLSFGAPWRLLALVAVPLLIAFAVAIRRRRSRHAVAFTNLEIAAAVAGARSSWTRHVPLGLLVAGVAVGCLAFARPRVAVVEADRGSAVVLLADVSGSMAATDVRPQRIYAAVKAMHQLVDALPAGDEVGLVSFSDAVNVVTVPTRDRAAVHGGLDTLSPEGGTALGDAIEAAVRVVVTALHAEGAQREHGRLPAAIVLESDGSQDRGAALPFQAAQFAEAAGVRIYGIALGTKRGFVDEGTGLLTRSIPVPPDPATVAMLARVTGGHAYQAKTASNLDRVYRQLGSTLGRRRRSHEITSWFDLVAAVLVVTGAGALRFRSAPLP
jgi:Ca-activated chloride channel family protein